MNDRFITLRSHHTVGEAQRRIRRKHREQSPTDINYLFVTDKDEKLVGIVSIRDLIFSDDEVKISDLMNREVHYVRTTDDQEEVVRRFEKYHFLGLPVLEEEGKLVGVIRSDEALSIAIEEQTEDINPTFFAGISQFETPDAYAKYLRTIATDDKKLYKMFSAQVFSLGLINQRKNNSLRKSMVFFVTALTSELMIIMYLAYLRAYSYLDDRIYQFIYGIIIISVIAITVSRYDLISKARRYLKV